MIDWYLEPIEGHILKIIELFEQNHDHKLAKNYLNEKERLFEYTKFARMGYYQGKMIYYSAGMERTYYNGSIRIMSRHTRDRNFDFGSRQDDLKRGLETLESSVKYAQNLGYTDIWISREFSNSLFKWFAAHSKYNWKLGTKLMQNNEYQYILQLK